MRIASDMKQNPNEWNGLGFLNSLMFQTWDRMLYKVINIQPEGWEIKFKPLVEFVKILRGNWFKSIPPIVKAIRTI